MAEIVLKADLKTHIPIVTIDKITGADDAIVTAAIATAISEAKGYISRFDLTKLFDTTATGYVADVNLQTKIKHIACWYLIQRSNVNVDMELFRTNYEDAIQWLKDVHKGMADPDGWPLLADDEDTEWPEDKVVHYTSNTKRNQQL